MGQMWLWYNKDNQHTDRHRLAAGPAILNKNQRTHQYAAISPESLHIRVLELDRRFYRPDALPAGSWRIRKYLVQRTDLCDVSEFAQQLIMLVIRSLTHRRRLGSGIEGLGRRPNVECKVILGRKLKMWIRDFFPVKVFGFLHDVSEFWCILRVTYDHTYEFWNINYLRARTSTLGIVPRCPPVSVSAYGQSWT